MKRMLSVLLTLVLCVGLAACGSGKAPEVLGEEVSGGITDEHVSFVIEIVQEFMETDAFKAMTERTAYKGVKSAMYYQASFDEPDVKLQLLLIELNLDDDIVGWDRLLVADLNNHDAFDVHALNMDDYAGEMNTYEDMLKQAFGGFDSFLMDRNPAVMTENEVRTPATMEQLEEINAVLGQ